MYTSTWRNRYFLISDLFLVPFALYLSFVLRLDRVLIGEYWPSFTLAAFLLAIIIPPLFYGLGIYSRYWRYASVEELFLLAGAMGLATLPLALGFWFGRALPFFGGIALPRSIPVIFFALALPAVGTPRLISRLGLKVPRRDPAPRASTPVLVIGAGQAGALTVRELRRNPQLGLDVVGFLDDDPAKQRLRIAGVPVLGRRASLPEIAARHGIVRVIIAMPGVPGAILRETVELCRRAAVRPQTVPGIFELLDGTVSVSQLRDVQIEDLLRRAPIQTDLAAVAALVRGRRVLVTGAGGSIGGELCRQLLRCGPDELLLLGHGENSIFEIHGELQRLAARLAPACGGATILHPVIADVRFPERLRGVFAAHRPEVVFHAAAHKHVPLMEANPVEAVANNVLGTRNVLAAAVAAGIERFVLVSTDKAVNPSSVMGATKRVAELLVHRAAAETGRDYMVTRFGNVLGSRGSVVLTMRRQIAAGGPVTVTHPAMTRYFMTIPEAVQLVLQAAALGRGGEVFVFDMGQPVKIDDLARDLIRLTGADRRGIEVVYSGVRPGEKLHEELFGAGEAHTRTRHEQIFTAAGIGQNIPADLIRAIATLEQAVERNDEAAVVRELQRLLPECRFASATPDDREAASGSMPLPAVPPKSVKGGTIPLRSLHTPS
jgi:FlaA1/EpsC-like NDP-sugar epimerase